MAKKTLAQIDVTGKKVLIRVDFNVPQHDDGSIGDDRRIRAALPTIQLALDKGAAVILMSHLGRPKGDPAKDAKFRLDPVAARLAELLSGVSVEKCDEVVGPQATQMAGMLQPGQVLLLENLRMHPGEKKGDETFAHELRDLADIYVNDAFGTCHRTDASMYAVPKAFPPGHRVVGLLVEKELKILGEILGSPRQPMVAVMGGAKVSDKIGVINALLDKVQHLLIGGAMTYTFRKAVGQSVGTSLVESSDEALQTARELLEKAGDKLVLPVDHLVATAPSADADTQIVEDEIPDGWCGVDIGPKTIEKCTGIVRSAATATWNGPMGKFEDEPFQAGTREVAKALSECPGITVVGGGESAEAVEKFGYADKLTHVSTGGGAFLEYIEGKPFDALSVIDEA